MQARIVRAPARAATPLHPCGDPRLRRSRSPLMDEDIPLPFVLPAAVVKYALLRLQAVNDCFQTWASHSEQTRNVAFPPDLAVAPSRRQRPLRGMRSSPCHQGRTAGVRSASRLSPGREAMGETPKAANSVLCPWASRRRLHLADRQQPVLHASSSRSSAALPQKAMRPRSRRRT